MAGNRQRWEKGQAVLHKKEQKILHRKDESRFEAENAYGSIRYTKENSDGRQEKRGFALEAKEAPGTLGHAENEKHLNPDKLKKVMMKGERFLYASGTPFKKQAVFYDVSEYERSRDFLECMKRLIRERNYRTLKDTFGFLEQDFDRQQKQELMQERKKELSLQEFSYFNRQIDSLNDRILKKEAKERQMRADLQRMLDREKYKEREEKKEEAGYREWKLPVFMPEQMETAEKTGTGGDKEDNEDNKEEERNNKIVKKRGDKEKADHKK